MILEKVKITRNAKKEVTRICDECGKKEKTKLNIIYNGRKTRKKDIDLCASCASSRKYRKCKRGKDHHSWKHGLAKGYRRMTWKYVTGDNYDLKQLYHIEDFFKTDYYSALQEVKKHESYRKWGLPNWRLGMIRREMGLEEAEANLIKVRTVINTIKREAR